MMYCFLLAEYFLLHFFSFLFHSISLTSSFTERSLLFRVVFFFLFFCSSFTFRRYCPRIHFGHIVQCSQMNERMYVVRDSTPAGSVVYLRRTFGSQFSLLSVWQIGVSFFFSFRWAKHNHFDSQMVFCHFNGVVRLETVRLKIVVRNS